MDNYIVPCIASFSKENLIDNCLEWAKTIPHSSIYSTLLRIKTIDNEVLDEYISMVEMNIRNISEFSNCVIVDAYNYYALVELSDIPVEPIRNILAGYTSSEKIFNIDSKLLFDLNQSINIRALGNIVKSIKYQMSNSMGYLIFNLSYLLVEVESKNAVDKMSQAVSHIKSTLEYIRNCRHIINGIILPMDNIHNYIKELYHITLQSDKLSEQFTLDGYLYYIEYKVDNKVIIYKTFGNTNDDFGYAAQIHSALAND